MIRPSCITATRSLSATISSRSLLIITTAAPSSARPRIKRWISTLARTSTPCVGSSKTMTRGRSASHLPSTTFCWLPPLSVATGVFDRRGLDRQRGRDRAGRPRPRGARDTTERGRTRPAPAASRSRERSSRPRRRTGADPRAPGRRLADGVARRANLRAAAVEEDASGQAHADAADRLGQLGAARADQAGDAEHLACDERSATPRRRDNGRCAHARSAARPVRPGAVAVGSTAVSNGAADHQLHEPVARERVARQRPGVAARPGARPHGRRALDLLSAGARCRRWRFRWTADRAARRTAARRR